MASKVNKQRWRWPERLVWWPESEAIEAAVAWANFSQHHDARRVGRALKVCNEGMHIKTNLDSWRTEVQGVDRDAVKVRRWMAAAVDAEDGLPADIGQEIDDLMAAHLRVLVVPGYAARGGFGGKRFKEVVTGLRPRPLAWAAMGVALVADNGSKWRLRVGRCVYHDDRFIFNAPVDGQRGPLRKFYCGPGCKVMMSRYNAAKKIALTLPKPLVNAQMVKPGILG